MSIRRYIGLDETHKKHFKGTTDSEILSELEKASKENPDFILPTCFFKQYMASAHPELESSQDKSLLDESQGKDFLTNTLLCNIEADNEINQKLLSLPNVDKTETKKIKIRSITFQIRNRDVREAIKSLYDYKCQVCGGIIYRLGWKPCMNRKQSWKYLSADLHHIHALSNGGPDIRSNTICLCPSCHRKFHTGEFRLIGDGNHVTCKDEVLGTFQNIRQLHLIDLCL